MKKWNEEDERKQIETQIEEQGEAEKDPQNTSNSKSNLTRFSNYYDETTTASARTGSSSLDLFPGVNEDADNNGDSAFNLELKSTFQWDDTSTIPPGQGDSVKDSHKSRLEASTPFSKLLNSSRRYSSASDDPQKMSSKDEVMPYNLYDLCPLDDIIKFEYVPLALKIDVDCYSKYSKMQYFFASKHCCYPT